MLFPLMNVFNMNKCYFYYLMLFILFNVSNMNKCYLYDEERKSMRIII